MYGRPNSFSFFLFPIWPLADLGHQPKLPQSHIIYSKWQPGYRMQSEWTYNSMRLLFSATVSRWRAGVLGFNSCRKVYCYISTLFLTMKWFQNWPCFNYFAKYVTLCTAIPTNGNRQLCSLLATHNKNLVAPLNTIQLIWSVDLNMCKLPCMCPVGKTHHFIHDAGLCSSVQSTHCFVITMSVSLFLSLHLLPLPVNCELVP